MPARHVARRAVREPGHAKENRSPGERPADAPPRSKLEAASAHAWRSLDIVFLRCRHSPALSRRQRQGEEVRRLTHRIVRPRRSLIFAPGNQTEMFPKALTAGADIVTIDLEDAIAPNNKASAREQTLAWFAENQEFGGVEAMVRVNCLRSVDGLADLRAIIESPHPPPALMLPKVKSPAEVHVHEELIEQAAAPIRLHVIIETNEGLDSCVEIARSSPFVDSLLFGGVDMAAELRVEPTWNALLHARSRVVHAAASAGVDVIDVPFLDLHDMDGLAREARACAELGFTGKGAIHPKQIPVLNGIFSRVESKSSTPGG